MDRIRMKYQRLQLAQYGAPLQHMAHSLLAAILFVSCALGQELLAAKHDFPSFPPSLQVGAKVMDLMHLDSHGLQSGAVPSNVTGLYRGTWRRQDTKGVEPAKLENLNKPEGLIIYKLRTTKSKVDGVHNVEGEVVIRDGVYVTEYDVEMKLQGVYIVQTRRLYATLEGLQPATLTVSLDATDIENQTASYRQALRDVGLGGSSTGLLAPFRFIHMQQREASLPDPASLQKTCEFRLELAVSPLAAPPPLDMPIDLPGRRRQLLDSSDLDSLVEADGLSQDSGAMVWGNRATQTDAVMNGTITSPNCHLELHMNATTDHPETQYAKAINYTLMITGLSFIQVVFLIRQMEATATQASAAKVSLATIGAQAIMDAYLCLLHLTIGSMNPFAAGVINCCCLSGGLRLSGAYGAGIMVEPLFNAFATAAFFEFVIFAIFEMRYLLSIWRARRQSSGEEWGAQRQLTILYARFYGALLGGIFLTYQLKRYMKYIVFGLYSFWVPQIVLCVRDDVRQPLKPAYVLGMSVTRLAMPLYLFGCPHNLLRVPFSSAICIGLVVYLAVQVLVLLLQSIWGPRCFIPKRFLPAKYDYYRPITPRQLTGEAEEAGDVETGDGSTECVICMNPVEVERPNARMVTPCDHFFHPACLNRWMDVKMECPTCRRSLPAP